MSPDWLKLPQKLIIQKRAERYNLIKFHVSITFSCLSLNSNFYKVDGLQVNWGE